jgi:hypothetical protein
LISLFNLFPVSFFSIVAIFSWSTLASTVGSSEGLGFSMSGFWSILGLWSDSKFCSNSIDLFSSLLQSGAFFLSSDLTSNESFPNSGSS